MVREPRIGAWSETSVPGSHLHDAPRRAATADDRELDALRAEVKSAYLGLGTFVERGILDNKIQGVHNMTTYLSGPDPSPVGASLLGTALSTGAEVAAAALAAATDGATQALVAALTVGSRIVASTFHRGGNRHSVLDPVQFTNKYYIALSNTWPDSVHHLLKHMTTISEARRIRDHVYKMRGQPAKIIAHQQNEILDAWVSAIRAQTQSGSSQVLV
jgi:hypothetical protein